MKANDQSSRRLLGPLLALLLLVGTVVMAMSSTPTLAGPPDPTIPQPEPFYIRLEQPLAGLDVAVEPLSGPIHTAAEPGEWYNLIAEEFDQDPATNPFPPQGWEVQTTTEPGWARRDEQWVSDGDYGGFSAGVVMTTTGTPNTWLFYGGDAGTGISLEDVADAKLDFKYWLNTEYTIDDEAVYFGWAASSDGQNFYGARISGRVGAWLTGVLDMQQYIGDDSVWIAFFVIGEATAGEQHVYVDNVRVRGKEPYEVYLPTIMNNYEPPVTTFTFTDDFSDSNSGWRYKVRWGSTDEQRRYVQGYTDKLMADYPNDYTVIGGDCRKEGRYFMRVGSRDFGAKVMAKAPVQVGSQFTLEADIAFCDNENYASTGLLFGLNDAQTEYYRVILIYNLGGSIEYAIWRDDSKILKNTSSSSYLKWKNEGFNKNTVKVVRNGCSFSVYFNGQKEWSTNSECKYTDQRWVGLFHDKYPGSQLTGATVDDFVVEQALEPSG